MKRLAEHYEVRSHRCSHLSVCADESPSVTAADLHRLSQQVRGSAAGHPGPRECKPAVSPPVSIFVILADYQLVSKRLFREHCVFYDGEMLFCLACCRASRCVDRALREGPVAAEPRHQPDDHRGQLADVLHLPPGYAVRAVSPVSLTDTYRRCCLSQRAENAIDCSSFFDDPADVELWQVPSCRQFHLKAEPHRVSSDRRLPDQHQVLRGRSPFLQVCFSSVSAD